MQNCLVCTPILPKLSHDGNFTEGIHPQATTWINLDQVVYAIAEQWAVGGPDERTQNWDIVQVVMADGTHFNLHAADWNTRLK